MATQSQVALQAINLVKALTDLHNSKYPHKDAIELPADPNPNWMTFCPAHKDVNNPSLHISFHDKVLFKCRTGCTQEAVLNKFRELNLWSTDARQSKFIVNNPAHAEADDEMLSSYILDEHGTLPTSVYSYRNEFNEPVFWVLRSDKPKLIKPLSSVTYTESGTSKFQLVHVPNNRPLYNLYSLLARPDVPVLIVEGEKTADAAMIHFPHLAVTTWSGGTGATVQTNFTTLKDRKVILWPDNDKPGLEAMERIAKILFSKGCQSVKMVFREIQTDLAKGFDIADFEEGDNRATIMLQEASILTPSDLAGPVISELKDCFADYNVRLIPLKIGKNILLIDISRYSSSLSPVPFVSYDYGSDACYASENQMVDIPTSKKPVYAIDEWFKTIKDNVHHQIVFDPSAESRTVYRDGLKAFNLFNGFPYKPVENAGAQIFVDHIELLLRENAAYFLDWLAHMIQFPAVKPGTFVLLKGPQGTGKTITGDLISMLIGENNSVSTTPKNIHSSFNSMLSGKIFVAIDEFYMETLFNKHSADEFKSIITEKSITINAKHVAVRQEASFHRFFATTNSDVPYTVDGNTRRDVIFDVLLHIHTNNRQYFENLVSAMYDPIRMSGFMFILKNRKITHNIRQAPETTAKTALYAPTDPCSKFVYDLCQIGTFSEEFESYYFVNENEPAVSNWPSSIVHLPRDRVVDYIRKRYRLDLTDNMITRKILNLITGPNSQPKWQTQFVIHENGKLEGGRIRKYTFEFLPLLELRQVYEQNVGRSTPIAWEPLTKPTDTPRPHLTLVPRDEVF
jgi:hypothetical protein